MGLDGPLTDVQLVPVGPQHEAQLREQELKYGGPEWRFGGQVPSPEEYHQRLWQGVVAQYLVIDAGERVLGLVACYQCDFVSGTAFLSAIRFGDQPNVNVGFIRGCLMFVSRLFNDFPLRKLYLESAESNSSLFGGGRSLLLTEEARFRERVWLNGQFEDLIVHSVSRDAWQSSRLSKYRPAP